MGKAKNKLYFLLLMSSFFLNHQVVAVSEGNLFHYFVEQPTESNYMKIVDSWERDPKSMQVLYKQFENDYESWGNLLKLIKKGEEWSIDLGLKLITLSDGGNLGDMQRAIGENITTNPEKLIASFRRNVKLSEKYCKEIFISLPLSYVDDIDGQISETRKRLGVFLKYNSQFNSSGCSEIKNKLEEDIRFLENVKIEIQQQ